MKFFLLATVCLLALSLDLTHGKGSPKKSSKSSTHKNRNGNRIAGGVEVTPHEFPFVARVFKAFSSGLSELKCAGIILNAKWVLTAAHCLRYEKNPTFYTITAGEHNTEVQEGKEQERKAVRLILHPKYEAAGIEDNDIGLVEIDPPFDLKVGIAEIVKLPPKDFQPTIPGQAVLIGWGKISSEEGRSKVLKKVSAPIMEQEECKKKVVEDPDAWKILESMICTENKGKGTCTGDSGGPMMCESSENEGGHVQCGIVSWGKGCGGDFPNIFARVSYDIVKWIKETIGEAE